MDNIILLANSYKTLQWSQYPPGTEKIYSYLETRTGGGDYPEVCFFGLQYILKRYLEGQVVTKEKVDEAAECLKDHIAPNTFNRENWDYITKTHGGRLPIIIKAVPEGTIVPRANVLMTVENTDPKCYWLTNYLEDILMHVWYGTTVATHSREMKGIFLNYLDKKGKSEEIDAKVIDLGFRSVGSVESAGIGGAAHLINFKRSENLAGLILARKYYHADTPAYSIPLMDHNVVISWGRDNEADAYKNMLAQHPNGTLVILVDSYDAYEAAAKIKGLRGMIESRSGPVYLCNDSGNIRGAGLNLLSKSNYIWGDVNKTPPNIKILYDGESLGNMKLVLEATDKSNRSPDLLTFAFGGGLLQNISRDTLRFAYKTSSIAVNGKVRETSKITADKWKVSKAGRMKLVKGDDGVLRTVKEIDGGTDVMTTVFLDGHIERDYTLEEVRENAFMF
jgi:nicotinamide phosphoribosyltransferase